MMKKPAFYRLWDLFLVLILVFSLLAYPSDVYAQVTPVNALFIDWDNAEITPGRHTVFGPNRMAVDTNNKIWFTASPLIIGEFNPATGQIIRHTHPCEAYSVKWEPTAIGVDKTGKGWVWFATATNIMQFGKYDPSTDQFTCIDLPLRVGVRDLVVDSVGNVWMAARSMENWTYSGIIKYDPQNGSFNIYDTPHYVQFSELYIDGTGNIWINDGFTSIWKMDQNGQFKEYNVDYASRGLTQDDVGNFWFGSGDRVARLNSSTGEVTTYNMPEGTHPQAFMKSDKGDIFFAGKNKMIHRMTPSTGLVIDYEMVVGWQGHDMGMDSLGNIWFTEGNSLVKIPRGLARDATTSQVVPVQYLKTINNIDGGKITTDFSDTITFPANSMIDASAELSMTMEKAPDPLIVGHQPIPRSFKFGPPGKSFTPSANNKVSYGVGVDLQAIDPANVGVYYWDGSTSSWVYQNSSNDVEKKTITFAIDHFSDYALFAPKVHFAWEEPLTENYNYPLANGNILPINFKLNREDEELVAQEHLKVKVTMPMHPHDPWFPERRTVKEFTIGNGLVYDAEARVYRAELDTSQTSYPGWSGSLPNGEFYKVEVFYAGLRKSEAEFSLLDPDTQAIVYTVAFAFPKANEKGWHHQDVKVNLKAYYLTLNPDDEGGIKEIHYQLDDNAVNIDEGNEVEVPITQEGERTLKYWAVDTQDREETVRKELKIKLDKTPPEALIYFDPDYKAFKIEVKADNLSGEEMVRPTGVEMLKPRETPGKGKSCSSRQIISYSLTDAAGNSLIVPLEIRADKSELKATIGKLVYNEVTKMTEENSFKYEWQLVEGNQLNKLSQVIEIEGKPSLKATYDSTKNETTLEIVAPEEKKPQIEVFSGMKILKVQTEKGQLEYLPYY